MQRVVTSLRSGRRLSRRRSGRFRASEVERLESRELLTVMLSTEEQYMLELINRARRDPEAEADRQGITLNNDLAPGTITTDAKQPLTPNQLLIGVAEQHSLDMLDRDFFSHTSPNPGSTTFAQRIANTGYPYTVAGENLSIRTYSGTLDAGAVTKQMHDDLYVSASHRANFFAEDIFEIGVGIEFGRWRDSDNLLQLGAGVTHDVGVTTQNFGTRAEQPFITGVVYTDASDGSSTDNHFYDPGEQARVGGTIIATDTVSGTTFTTTIGPSGGYALAVTSDRNYYVVASGGGMTFDQTFLVSLKAENQKVDFETTTAPTNGPVITAPDSVEVNQRPTIAWDALTGAEEYEIWIKNQSTDVNPYLLVTVSTTSYTPDFDLEVGRFNLWLRGISGSGETTFWTQQYNFNIVTAPTIAAMERFQPTHRPTINWAAIPGADHYDVWINDHSGDVNGLIRDTDVSINSFTPSFDMRLSQYRLWVRAVAADGLTGQWSRMTEFFVVPSPIVTRGQNPTFDQTPVFAWNELAGAAEYEVFIRNRNNGATALHETEIAALSFEPTATLEEGPYRWWAVGVSTEGVRSQWTAPMDIYVGGRTDILTPVGTVEDDSPTITWRPVEGAVRYDLWVDVIDGTRQIIREENLTTTSFTATPLGAGNYRIWVRAVSDSGDISPWSLESDFSVIITENGGSNRQGLDTLPVETIFVHLNNRRLSNNTPTAESELRQTDDPTIEVTTNASIVGHHNANNEDVQPPPADETAETRAADIIELAIQSWRELPLLDSTTIE